MEGIIQSVKYKNTIKANKYNKQNNNIQGEKRVNKNRQLKEESYL